MKQPSSLPTTGTVRMYHGTQERFERFSLDFAARPGMSGNGHLGVWLAVQRHLAECFGQTCLDVDAQVEKPYVMPLKELSRLNDQVGRLTRELDDDAEVAATERRFYAAYRVELLIQGYDIIYLEEADGRIEMAIGLVPDKLTIQ
jgi:hypothetical protein